MDGCTVLIKLTGEVLFRDTPVFGKRGQGRREHDVLGMLQVLRDLRAADPYAKVWLEHVAAFPKNGSIGNFKLGEGFGLWKGLLAADGVVHELVRPQRWKREVLDGAAKTPQAEAAIAARLYPAARQDLVGPKGGLREGRVDALLIAHYGLRRSAPIAT